MRTYTVARLFRPTMAMSETPQHIIDQQPDRYRLSLAQGGPLYQLLLFARLSGPNLQMLRRRIAVILVVTWLPLLVLATLEGHAWGGVGVSFLADIGAQVRFLVALPLLIVAERVVHRWMHDTIPLFIERGIVDSAQHADFIDAIVTARRSLQSVPAELALLALVYIVGFSGGLPGVDIAGATWHSVLADDHSVTTLAGWWLVVVSLPLFQFLLLRWYVRLLVWWRFLWQVSRIKLEAQPLLADRMGGLGFLSRLSVAFVPLLLAQSTLASSLIANQILYADVALSSFRLVIAAVSLFLIAIILVPLFAFVPSLARAKLEALTKLEAMAIRYTREFSHKWLRADMPPGEPLLGTPDIQSLADLGNSYEVLRNMRVVPIGIPALMTLLAAVLVPMLPLLLTTFSLQELASRVVKVLL